MKEFRYIDGVSTLRLEREACVGCGRCMEVCPHLIFGMWEKKAEVLDHDACIECGACAQNCPARAISVSPGVGCASYVIAAWISRLRGRKVSSACC